MTPALALLTDTATTADLERIQAAMLAWLTDDATGPPLHQRLGLSRRSARCELRNRHLRQAAALITATGATDRAEQLAERCRTFEVRQWPRLRRQGCDLDSPPLTRALYQARQFGPIDLGARQLLNIL